MIFSKTATSTIWLYTSLEPWEHVVFGYICRFSGQFKFSRFFCFVLWNMSWKVAKYSYVSNNRTVGNNRTGWTFWPISIIVQGGNNPYSLWRWAKSALKWPVYWNNHVLPRICSKIFNLWIFKVNFKTQKFLQNK